MSDLPKFIDQNNYELKTAFSLIAAGAFDALELLADGFL